MRPLVNQFNDNLAYTNLFQNQCFSVNQSDLRGRKERINKLFKGDVFMRDGNEGSDILSDSRKRYCAREQR